MPNEALKKQAAQAALAFIGEHTVIGVGTGSTTNYFIEALVKFKSQLEGVVSSSHQTTQRLKAVGIPVLELNAVGPLPLYVDGTDEVDRHLRLIKGGGGALTREKVIAAASEQFVCIADHTKLVDVLGTHPVPTEVLPMARSFVAREIVKRGGQPVLRENFTTDNGHLILDVYNLNILEPAKIEAELNNIPGLVAVGLFAQRRADVLLLGTPDGIREMRVDR